MAVQYTVPPAWLIGEMTTESEAVSNGVWNSIICNYLPQNLFVVMPEYPIVSRGERPDMVAADIALNRHRLVFEGKIGGGGNAAWDTALAQELDYLNGLTATSVNLVGMVAIGPLVVFCMLYQGDVRQISPSNGSWKRETKGTLNKLKIDVDAATINAALNLVRNNTALPA